MFIRRQATVRGRSTSFVLFFSRPESRHSSSEF